MNTCDKCQHFGAPVTQVSNWHYCTVVPMVLGRSVVRVSYEYPCFQAKEVKNGD